MEPSGDAFPKQSWLLLVGCERIESFYAKCWAVSMKNVEMVVGINSV
jgi:hypothetical protein